MNVPYNENIQARAFRRIPEASLQDILAGLRRYAWIIVAAPLICGLAAFLALRMVPPVYEATAAIRVGNAVNMLMETTAVTAERIEQPEVQKVVLAKSGIDPDGLDGRLVRATLATEKKDGYVVALKFRVRNREQATAFVGALVAYLQDIHAKGAEGSVALQRKRREALEQDLAKLRARMTELDEATRTKSTIGVDKTTDRFLAAWLMWQTATELRNVETAKAGLDETFTPWRNYPTDVLAPVALGDMPVGPRPRYVVAVAAVAGLILGVFLALALYLIRDRSFMHGGDAAR
jgi:ElaB/YqjD/DUF883 family membrane-anchored ribosome-binding protein